MRTGRVVLAVGLAASSLVVLAPTASAGCEFHPEATYCDGPVGLDGNWNRCYTQATQFTYGQFGQVTSVVPASTQCYTVDPDTPPTNPVGQPPYHIFP